MIRPPPRSTRPDPLVPYTTRSRSLHGGSEYRVYRIGFAPGFSYLGGLYERLHTPRRTEPRLRTPAGSVSIGGMQAAVSSVEVPSGWHMQIGRASCRERVCQYV